jgi:hypothetical protein
MMERRDPAGMQALINQAAVAGDSCAAYFLVMLRYSRNSVESVAACRRLTVDGRTTACHRCDTRSCGTSKSLHTGSGFRTMTSTHRSYSSMIPTSAPGRNADAMEMGPSSSNTAAWGVASVMSDLWMWHINSPVEYAICRM